jgi:hypothetical protein
LNTAFVLGAHYGLECALGNSSDAIYSVAWSE